MPIFEEVVARCLGGIGPASLDVDDGPRLVVGSFLLLVRVGKAKEGVVVEEEDVVDEEVVVVVVVVVEGR
jgi:hypothetical protein